MAGNQIFKTEKRKFKWLLIIHNWSLSRDKSDKTAFKKLCFACCLIGTYFVHNWIQIKIGINWNSCFLHEGFKLTDEGATYTKFQGCRALLYRVPVPITGRIGVHCITAPGASEETQRPSFQRPIFPSTHKFWKYTYPSHPGLCIPLPQILRHLYTKTTKQYDFNSLREKITLKT